MSAHTTSGHVRKRAARADAVIELQQDYLEQATPRRSKRQRLTELEVSPPPPKGETPRRRENKKIKSENDIKVELEIQAASLKASQDSCSSEVAPKSTPRRKTKIKVKGDEALDFAGDQTRKSIPDTETPRKKPKKAEGTTSSIKVQSKEVSTPTRPKRKRKTQEEKEAEAMPLAPRSTSLRMFLGAHVSASGGVQNTPPAALHIGANAFAMFLKSQRKWENPPLKDEHHAGFLSACKENSYDQASHVLPHGSYLVNLAQPEPEKAKQAYGGFRDDLERCERLGIRYYNFHPGWTGGAPRNEAIGRIANHINTAHKATTKVIPVLETMAGSNNVIGSTFADLAAIIDGVHDKSRVGVCLDTCHVFAAGYDLRSSSTLRAVLDDFDRTIGMQYLKALHINDSKAPFGSHRDLHQNIGLGFLGLRAFHNVMNETRFENLPMVLETPIDHKDQWGKDIEDKRVWAREIKLLESLVGMDPESAKFKSLETELAEKGKEERTRMEESIRKKEEKAKKKGSRKSMDSWIKGKQERKIAEGQERN